MHRQLVASLEEGQWDGEHCKLKSDIFYFVAHCLVSTDKNIHMDVQTLHCLTA